MDRLALLAEVETAGTSRCQPMIDRHEENEEGDFLNDALERWHDRAFNRGHTEH